MSHPRQYASVIVDQKIDKPLDYSIPPELQALVKPGMRVLVPLRKKMVRATILEIQPTSAYEDALPIQEILSDEQLIGAELFDLMHWVSNYYGSPLRKTLAMVMPTSVKKEIAPKKQLFISKGVSQQTLIDEVKSLRKRSQKQAAVLDVILKHPKGLLLTELMTLARVTKSPIDSLLEKKLLASKKIEVDRSELEEETFFQSAPKQLNSEQQHALDEIKSTLAAETFATHLLFGVTGSGKTEVYMQAMESALAKGKSVLLLVPEIALTKQTIERLKSRFNQPIAILHYRLSQGERFKTWHALRKGEIKIAVGARSAIFAPIQNLGLILVDEEQETSYKQFDEMPCYNARDVAIMRAKLSSATVVLGSATPSLETFTNALEGKYNLLTLQKRAGSSTLPKVHIIDMLREYEKSGGPTLFSAALLSGIEKRVQQGEQTLLFLNRRGFFSTQICVDCNEPLTCKHCDVTLTYHKGDHLLSCHICGYTLGADLPRCPSCQSDKTMKYRGPGTEQVERALHMIFPDIRTLRMDRDTTLHKGSHDRIFKEFKSGKADVLIGTQMIAKGLHFPAVTLVGVIDADAALHIPDFRSSEFVFQLITQVSGRSGRGLLPGEVILQTKIPDLSLFQLAAEENYKTFYNQEIDARKLFDYPPFKRLAKITIYGYHEQRTIKYIENLHRDLQRALPTTCTLYPITPASKTRVKDKYYFQFLIKTPHISGLGTLLKRLESNHPRPKGIYALFDIDPLSV